MSFLSFAAVARRAGPVAFALSALFTAAPVLAPARAQSTGAATTRPTIAIMYFTNGAFGPGSNSADYAPLSKSMAEMMITEMGQNDAIQVVERDRLQSLIEEQNLQNSDRVDKETAVKLGKILGARHILMGTFTVQKDETRLDVRCVDTETSAIEFSTSVIGRTDKMLSLVIELGAKSNKSLKLPPLKTASRTESAAKGPNQFRATLLMGQALEAHDRKNTAAEVALYKQALDANPNLDHAKVLLASAERTQKP